MFTYVTLTGLPENRKTPRRIPQDATDRRKTPQNASYHETKIQHKYGTKFRPQKCVGQ